MQASVARVDVFQRPTAADFDAVCALLAANGLPTLDLTPSLLTHFRIGRDDGSLVAVGGIEIHGPIGLLRSLAVAGTHRGQGLARRLVATLEADAARVELDALYLLTTTAASFFAARGYMHVARDAVPAVLRRSAEFSSLCPASATCMTKSLAC